MLQYLSFIASRRISILNAEMETEPALEPFTQFTFERSERFEGKLREGFSMTLPKSMAV